MDPTILKSSWRNHVFLVEQGQWRGEGMTFTHRLVSQDQMSFATFATMALERWEPDEKEGSGTAYSYNAPLTLVRRATALSAVSVLSGSMEQQRRSLCHSTPLPHLFSPRRRAPSPHASPHDTAQYAYTGVAAGAACPLAAAAAAACSRYCSTSSAKGVSLMAVPLRIATAAACIAAGRSADRAAAFPMLRRPHTARTRSTKVTSACCRSVHSVMQHSGRTAASDALS